jgi:hypothetical protein
VGSLKTTQERFQADHRLASEGPGSPQKSSEVAGGKLRATGYEDSRFVFVTRKGTPMDAQNIVNRHFKPLLNRAGLPLSAGTISGTRAPPCFWDAVFIRNWSSIYLGMPA